LCSITLPRTQRSNARSDLSDALIGAPPPQDSVPPLPIPPRPAEPKATPLRATSALDAQLDDMMGDAPVCDGCGHITVRNGACYKCLNCGNSMGCS
jgi:hypothetical protein